MGTLWVYLPRYFSNVDSDDLDHQSGYPEKPFERYADDVVVHWKTEKQAI